MRHILFGMIPLLAGIAIGCDNKPVALPAADTTPAEPAHVAPTTQELLDGPRKKLSLPTMRLAVSVPEGWSLDSSDPKFVMLQGPAPSGDVQIQLSPRSALNADLVEPTHANWKKDAASDPLHIQVPDIHEINGMKIMERIEIPGPSSRPSVQTPITWEVIIYIPDGDSVLPREFHFIDLTPAQYASDGTFLRSILDSITKDNSDGIQ